MHPLDVHIKNVIDRYYSSWFRINAIYEDWAKRHDLTFNALFSLYFVYENPKNCTQKFICDTMLLPKQTINAIFDSFEKKGIITKTPIPEDRRNKHIKLTSAGQKYAKALFGELYEFEEKTLKSMTETQREGMVQNSQFFLEALQRSIQDV